MRRIKTSSNEYVDSLKKACAQLESHELEKMSDMELFIELRKVTSKLGNSASNWANWFMMPQSPEFMKDNFSREETEQMCRELTEACMKQLKVDIKWTEIYANQKDKHQKEENKTLAV